jgi:hypothetical protein
MSVPTQLLYEDQEKFNGMKKHVQEKVSSELVPLLKNLGDSERAGTGNLTSEGQQRGITRDIPGTGGYMCLFDDADFCPRASELILNVRHGNGYDERGFGENAENIRCLYDLAVKALTHFESLSGPVPYDRECVITSFTAIRDATQALLAWYEKYFASA